MAAGLPSSRPMKPPNTKPGSCLRSTSACKLEGAVEDRVCSVVVEVAVLSRRERFTTRELMVVQLEAHNSEEAWQRGVKTCLWDFALPRPPLLEIGHHVPRRRALNLTRDVVPRFPWSCDAES